MPRAHTRRRLAHRTAALAAASALLLAQPAAAQSAAEGTSVDPAASGVAVAASAASRVIEAGDHCEPVAVLAFRGSGEPNIDSSVTSSAGRDHAYAGSALVTNGWEGGQLSRLLAAYAPLSFPDGFEVDTVPVVSVGPEDDSVDYGYPAIAAPWEALGRLNGSAEQGVAAAQRIMGDFKEEHSVDCPTATRFVTVGYSQGAMVARLVAQQNPADVAGVIDLGDPYQKPDAPGNEGEGADGQGFMRWNYPWYQDAWDGFYDLDLHRTALCHRDDPICDFADNVLGGFANLWTLVNEDRVAHHTNYLDGTHETAAAKAGELADLVHRIDTEAGSAEPGEGGSVDVVFTIDTTGSMSPYISQAVATAQEVAEATLAAAPGSRVGLVEYRDHGDDFVSRTVTPLTTDFDALTTGLSTLVADGGGDWPEAVYSGIVTSAHLDWRADASRAIVVLGDAPPHDPEPVTGHTAASVTALLTASPFEEPEEPLRRSSPTPGPTIEDQERDAAPGTDAGREPAQAATAAPAAGEEGTGLPIVLYNLSADGELSRLLQPAVDATGGLTLDLDDSAAVGAALTDALEDTVSAPVAALGASPLVTVGIETSLSAVGTTAGDPALTFEFDVDGDGTYEVTNTTGVATTTYAAPGEITASVRVTDSRGRASVASTTFEVAPAEAVDGRVDVTEPTFSVTATPTGVTRGQAVTVTTAGAPEGAALTLLLSPVTEIGSPFAAPPVFTVDTLPEGWEEKGITVPSTVPAGDYHLAIGADTGDWGTALLRVLDESGPVPGCDPDFPDNAPGSPYHVSVRWMACGGLTTGYADGTFRKDREVTRGETTAFLHRYEQPDFTAPEESPFSDVTVRAPFFTPITWAAAEGVTMGYADRTFRPSRSVTRAEFAMFLYRLADPAHVAPEASPFPDVATGGASYGAVTWLASQGITLGDTRGNFNPRDPVTRGQISAFLHRYEVFVVNAD